jgi:serine/threonine protein kinase
MIARSNGCSSAGERGFRRSPCGGPALLLLFLIALCLISAVAAGTTTIDPYTPSMAAGGADKAKFFGTALTGLSENSLVRGGATLGAQLQDSSRLRFNATMTGPAILERLQFSIRETPSSNTSCWFSNRDKIFGPGTSATVSNHGRTLKIKFGALPTYNCSQIEAIRLVIPATLLTRDDPTDSNAAPVAVAPSDDIIGPTFFVVPKGRVHIDSDDSMIATVPATLTLVQGNVEDLKGGFRIVDGTTCSGADAQTLGKPTLNIEAKTIEFVPLLGGTLSLCYTPPLGTSNYSALGQVQIRAEGTIDVSGPEGFASDPIQPRADTTFEVTVFGNGLTSEDLVALAKGRCSEVPLTSDAADVTLQSPSRATAVLTASEPGEMNVCYYRAGGFTFTQVASIFVQKGVEYIVDHDIHLFVSTGDTVVERNARINFLTLESGSFQLDHYHLNVTHFIWTGGTLTGRGVVNLGGTNSQIAANEPRTIQSFIRNYGQLQLDVQQLSFDDSGYLENFGTIVIKVNSTATSAATIRGPLDTRVRISNGYRGKIRIVAADGVSACKLQIDAIIENKGEMTVSSGCELSVRRMQGEASSSVIVDRKSTFSASSGTWRGSTMTLNEESRVTFGGTRNSLRGVKVQGSNGKLEFTEGSFELEQLTVTGTVQVLMFGKGKTTSQILLGGHSYFGPSTVLAVRDVVFESSFGTSHLDIDGRLLCDIGSVTFGDNLVLAARLQSVLFGVGQAGEAAELVPQRMPLNSSLVVPPNATLVILDMGGNRTSNATKANKDSPKSPESVRKQAEQAVPPSICSSFLVVPMYVKSEGQILLHGCAMLPFGGSQSGMYGELSVEAMETMVQYALCRNALSLSDVCIAVFPTEPDSGLILGGEHSLMLPASGSSSNGRTTNTLQLPSAQWSSNTPSTIDVRYLHTLKKSVVESKSPIQILAEHGLLVEGQLRLAEGALLKTSLLTVNGILSANSHYPTFVDGPMNVRGILELGLNIDSCAFPLSVSSNILMQENATLRCQNQLNITSGASAALVRSESLTWSATPTFSTSNAGLAPTLTPTRSLSNCVPADMAVRLIQYESEGSLGQLELPNVMNSDSKQLASSLGIQFDRRDPYPSTTAKLIAVGLSVLAMGVILTLHYYQLSFRSVGKELLKRTEAPAHLSWTEFAAFPSNFVAVGSFWVDALLLSAPAFHPLLPIPSVGHLSSISRWLLFGGDHPTYSLEASLLFACVGIWIFAWIPLVGKKFSTVLKTLLHNREHNCQRQAVRLLFQFHTFASFLAMALFIPVLSIFTNIIGCSTLLSREDRCQPLQPLFYPALLFWFAFHYLAPYAPTCRSFPFGHPPYRRELDIRYKRVYVYTVSALYFLQVCLWKMFPNHPLQLLNAVFIIQGFVVLLNIVAAPCLYANINRMKCVVALIPMWATLCGIIQVLRHGSDQPEFVCNTGDSTFLVLLFSGWSLIVIAALLSSRQYGDVKDPLQSDATAAIHLSTIKANQTKLEEYRVELYNTGSSRARSEIADAITNLRIHQLGLLGEYRRKKELIALPYYLGETLGSALLGDTTVLNDLEEGGSTPLGDVAMKTFVSKQPQGINGSPASPGSGGTPGKDCDLTFEQMENFIQGPILGKGSYGSVYMGMLPDGRLVAVKEVELSRKHKKELLVGLKKEINLLRTLVHPNVVRYYGAHSTGRHMRVFMEFAVGGSLTSLVRKFDHLSEPVARRYVQQILCGLEYLHSKHVIHRDIKGENILIDGQGVAKLADFGCSKGLSDIANKSREGCDSLVGSPYWMAPEVIRSEAYGTKADIWSVGCTVVEVLNGGNPPWYDKFDNVYTAMYYIGSTTDLPNNIPDDVSDQCKDFLSRCFVRDPSLRASATELLQHPWIADVHQSPLSATAGGASGQMDPENNPIQNRQWSDMFEVDSAPSGSNTLASRPPAQSVDNLDSLQHADTDSLAGLMNPSNLSSNEADTSAGPNASDSRDSGDSTARQE